jgi:hypothetical protein
MAPVKDPWFKATELHMLGSSQVWKSNYSATVIGCTEQYQFCNWTSCTELNARYSIDETAISALNYNPIQKETFNLVSNTLEISQMDYIIVMLQDNLLTAKTKLFGKFLFSAPLPENQWEQELMNLNNVSLTVLETSITSHADLPDLQVSQDTTLHQLMIRENSSEALQICQNQKTPAPGYYSFNVLGLVIILAGGSFIIILSHALQPIISKWRAGQKLQSHSSLCRELGWMMDDILSLASIALDANGIGPWSSKWETPIPENIDQKFCVPWIKKRLADEPSSDDETVGWDPSEGN